MFGTRTKDTGYQAVGIELVRAASAAAAVDTRSARRGDWRHHTRNRAAAVIAAGATSVAVIGDLFATGDPEARTRAYVERLQSP